VAIRLVVDVEIGFNPSMVLRMCMAWRRIVGRPIAFGWASRFGSPIVRGWPGRVKHAPGHDDLSARARP
jgi:hypothetical protein